MKIDLSKFNDEFSKAVVAIVKEVLSTEPVEHKFEISADIQATGNLTLTIEEEDNAPPPGNTARGTGSGRV